MTPTIVLSNWASMILPMAGIAIMAALLPLMLARLLPQSMGGLAVNLVVSAGILLAVSMAYFASFRPSAAIGWDLLRVGLLSMMIWGPIVLLVLAMQPQKWRPEI